MTGFGSAQTASAEVSCRCDIRSVNGKGLDIKLRMPNGLEALEADIKKRVSAIAKRGNVQLFLTIEPVASQPAGSIDMDLMRDLHAQSMKAADALGLAAPSMDALLGLRGVVVSEAAGPSLDLEDPTIAQTVKDVVDQALAQLHKVRQEEGIALVEILNQHLNNFAQLLDRAMKDEDSQPHAIKQRFQAQLDNLLDPKEEIDEARLAAEIALLATRADIREEIDRLQTHVEAARALLDEADTIGRRFDFLTQEFNREANTLCSKSASKNLTAIGLEMKAVIDQMREQVQNLQ
ncbi:MAG: YicC/YloC family endoribonuclease [Pseudomonadota bacterium]